MAITKRTEYGARTFLPDGQLQVRVDTVIEEDGKEISRTYYRKVLEPDQDISGEPAEIKRVANADWTPAVKAAYAAAKAARAAAPAVRP